MSASDAKGWLDLILRILLNIWHNDWLDNVMTLIHSFISNLLIFGWLLQRLTLPWRPSACPESLLDPLHSSGMHFNIRKIADCWLIFISPLNWLNTSGSIDTAILANDEITKYQINFCLDHLTFACIRIELQAIFNHWWMIIKALYHLQSVIWCTNPYDAGCIAQSFCHWSIYNPLHS